jgi:hypoxanthine phosphoribosyltransferase
MEAASGREVDELRFAHPAERELARVFDALRSRWRYEPHTFVLRRNGRGHVKEAFTPDFYLPDLDYYVECTTARRPLTRVKRRKAEAASRLYGIMVEIVYRADFETLARRWSLGRLAAALERTE